MSTVSRICLRCRIRILSNGPALPSAFLLQSRGAGQRSLHSRSHPPQSRLYSTKSTKITDTPDDSAAPTYRVNRPRTDFDPMADPVLVKLTGIVEPLIDKPPKRTSGGITTVDVEEFLAKAKRTKQQNEEVLPTGIDAHMIDERYGELLEASTNRRKRVGVAPSKPPPPLADLEAKFNYPSATHLVEQIDSYLGDKTVVIHGFIKKVRKVNKKVSFLDLYDYRSGPDARVQVVSSIAANASEEQKAMHNSLHKLPPFVPVCVKGIVTKTKSPPPPGGLSQDESQQWGTGSPMHKPEIQLELLIQLNSVSPNLIYTPTTVFPPEKRHLQLRTSPLLTDTLRMRNKVSDICRQSLRKAGFLEVETPLLFKSTPEGAREFLVPTRTKGMCYALPQSPQQYKQILMASGVARYFQFAKCFRDEDLRADRQPEFTQLDLEMSFARKEDVIRIVHKLISDIFYKGLGVDLPYGFRRMTYLEAMHSYGTDKPDLRHGFLKIHKVHFDEADGSRDSIEAFHIRRKDTSPRSLETMKNVHDQFVAEFKGDEYRFRSYVAGESSAYGIPELGLTASIIETVNERLSIEEGDIVLLKRRRGGFIGGSTIMGRLRQALINKAVEAGVLAKPKTYEFVWITDFPLFTPVTSDEPGQSGTVGFASTHHPFTAPHEDDFELLATDPLKVRAEHYDIVVNGVELGGGSRRIHDPELQRYILEDVIKVHPDKLRQFDHLIDVLGSGCPPHAGIALGFDRLIAVLMGTDNIREVIAFPKNSNGADPLVGSPSLVTDEDLATYWLRKTRQ